MDGDRGSHSSAVVVRYLCRRVVDLFEVLQWELVAQSHERIQKRTLSCDEATEGVWTWSVVAA